MADPWGTAGSGDAPGYMDDSAFAEAMDSVYGRGNWRPTGGWRSQARENQLRAQGAYTTRPGVVSAHSRGTVQAPGAWDIVVNGMSPQEAAAKLREAQFPAGQVLPEGAHGSQGPHLHVAMVAGATDPWGTSGEPERAAPRKAADPWGVEDSAEPVKRTTKRGLMESVASAPRSFLGGMLEAGGQAVRGFSGIVDMGVRTLAGVEGRGGDVIDPMTGMRILPTPTPQEREEQARLAREGTPVAMRAAEPTARAMVEKGRGLLPKDANLADRVVAGVGSFVPAVGAFAIDPLVGASTFGAQGYGATYEEAKAAGASEEVAQRAAAENAALQASLGLVPIGKIGAPLTRSITGRVAGAAARTGVAAAGAGALGGTMQTGSNIVARQNYDPERGIFEGVPEAALEMGLAGGLIHAGGEGLAAIRARRAARPGAPAEAEPAEPMPETMAADAYANMARARVRPESAEGAEVRRPEAEVTDTEGNTVTVEPEIPRAPPPEYEQARAAEGAAVEDMPDAIKDVEAARRGDEIETETEGDLLRAEVGPDDSNPVAAAKLAAYRASVRLQTGEQMDALRARADALGVQHVEGQTFDELLSDVVNHEATLPEYDGWAADHDEALIDAALTPEEHDWLATAEEGDRGERGPAGETEAAQRAKASEPEAPGGNLEPGPGAGGGGEGPEALPQGSELTHVDPLALYASGKEDGRHRAVAAKELGIKKVPVLTWNGSPTSRPRSLYEREVPLYSAAARAIERSTTKSATPAQWKATLENAQGVKKEELDWTGIKEWLDLFPAGEKVPKDKVEAFLRDHGVKVREVVLNGTERDRVRPDPEVEAKYAAEWKEYSDRSEAAYRDMLRARERGDYEEAGRLDQIRQEASDALEALHTKIIDETLAKQRAVIDGPVAYEDWKEPGGEDYHELLLTLPEVANPPATHWDTEGVMAHVRFDTRDAPDGKKVLFIEEVQSDWHQKGRDQGYAQRADQKEIERLSNAFETAQREAEKLAPPVVEAAERVLRAVGVPENQIPTPNYAFATEGRRTRELARDLVRQIYNTPQAQFRDWQLRAPGPIGDMAMANARLRDAELAVIEARQAFENAQDPRGIADAPFKSSWPALVMKRVIVWAADHGFDRVAWTSGDQQKERYRLSHRVSRIRLEDNASGGAGAANLEGPFEHGELRIYGPTGDPIGHGWGDTAIQRHHRGRQELERTLGRELTERLLSAEPRQDRSAGLGVRVRELTGLDVNVGGEGMNAFYDRNLVNITNDLIKKYGAKVERAPVKGTRGFNRDLDLRETEGGRWELFHKDSGERVAGSPSFRDGHQAERWIEENGLSAGEQHGFEITEKMREAATNGFPLFKREDMARHGIGETTEPKPEDQRLVDQVQAIIARIAPKAEGVPFGTIRDTAGHRITGASWREGASHIIAWSLESATPGGTARHEAVHALRSQGLFKPQEWDALEAAALEHGWLDRYSIRDAYPEFPPEIQIEEAIASRFSEWAQDRSAVTDLPSFVRALFERIWKALQAIKAAVRKALGADVTAADVFAAMEKGEIGQRSERLSRRDTTLFERPTSDAFKRWFGKSKVVDKDRKPLIVYHGTERGGFDRFDPTTVGANSDAPAGFYFTEDRRGAATYSGSRPEADAQVIPETDLEGEPFDPRMHGEPGIYPVYLKIEDPLRVNFRGHGWDGSGPNGWNPDLNIHDVIQRAINAGHDGVIVSNVMDEGRHGQGYGWGEKTYVVFKPEQIKSATANRGTYDPSDPRILFERERAERDTRSLVNKMLGEGVDAVGAKISRAANRFLPDPLIELGHAVRMGTNPMSAGSMRAKAMAKDFANALREHQWEWNRVDEWLAKTFDREARARMWAAADEESVIRQQGNEPGPDEGLNALDPTERAAVEELQRRANVAFNEAKALGMTAAEGLPSYVPRMVVEMTAEGARRPRRERAGTAAGVGANLKTSSAQLRQRKHLTTEETEAAAKARFGEGATVIKDIRTLAFATGKLEQAIAGRRLINQIKEATNGLGNPAVTEGGTPDPQEMFTLDHPAFRTWRPKFVVDGETGKVGTIEDPTTGKPVMEAVPLYVSKEFEGPLNAVMSRPTGPIVHALTNLKARAMSVIMYSPLMHNAVIWGKAIPAAPRSVLLFQVYFRGNKAKNDMGVMREALRAGLDPIGRRYFNQDVTAIMEGPQIEPGRSWTAKLLAAIPGAISKDWGTAVKSAVDKAGDVWHNTFLWDRVADLQMGLYTIMRDSFVKEGLDPESAQRIAAHYANRYAGALPIEAMSKLARSMANMLLFSRSFTFTNIGAWKDMLVGMPGDVQAQILRDAGPELLKRAQGTGRRKAVGLIILDIALAHIGLLLASSAVYYIHRLLNDPQEFQPHWANEPERKNRFLIGYDDQGTAIYGRLPTGKVAEDIVDWVIEPVGTGERKLSPFSKLALQIASNDKGFGRKLYDPHDYTPTGYLRNLGRVIVGADVANLKSPDDISGGLLGGIAPMAAIQGATHLATNDKDRDVALMQTVMPLFGVTVSKGAPGGPAAGELFRARDEHDFKVAERMPRIRQMIRRGDIEEARGEMTELGISPGLQSYYIRSTRNPAVRLSGRRLRDFMRYATPEAKEQFRAEQRAAAERRAGEDAGVTP